METSPVGTSRRCVQGASTTMDAKAHNDVAMLYGKAGKGSREALCRSCGPQENGKEADRYRMPCMFAVESMFVFLSLVLIWKLSQKEEAQSLTTDTPMGVSCGGCGLPSWTHCPRGCGMVWLSGCEGTGEHAQGAHAFMSVIFWNTGALGSSLGYPGTWLPTE